MVLEINQHTIKNNLTSVQKDTLPEGTFILPAIWAMHQKRRIDTCKIYKWKSRLNLGGHKIQQSIHFDETLSPVVTWQTIWLFLIIVTINKWASIQLDFIMAYMQADINKPAYMELPPGINIPGLVKDTHCLKIMKNLYGGKEAGRTWFKHLSHILTTELTYTQSKYDECVYYKGSSNFFVYTDDGIMMDPDSNQANQRITELQNKFNIKIQGSIHDYLGICIQNNKKGSINML
jgi:Reverse transcriptase (RNA-dependent DNA polymerase)